VHQHCELLDQNGFGYVLTNEGLNASQHLTRKRHVRLGRNSTVPVAESDVHRDDICKSVGAGVYYAIDENENIKDPGPGRGKLSVLVSISRTYRFTDHWDSRLTWNRVVTRYDRDSDVILAGVGYRW
jgi:hypothetical protein